MNNSAPIDKGRLVAVVSYYPARENGQPVFNPDGSQKMKPKYMAIGEVTKWPGDGGGSYDKITQFLNPPSLPCETRIFWDSESSQQEQQGGYQQPQQQPQRQPGYQRR